MSISKALAVISVAATALLAGASCGDDFGGDRDATAFDGKFDWPDAQVFDARPQSCQLLCPNPTVGKNTICGQLLDFETDQPIEVAEPTGVDCQDVPVEDRAGPCLLSVLPYDALALFQNPTGSAPQASDSITVNDCGRFAAVNVQTPSLGFLALAVDDAEADPGDWVTTAVSFPVAPGDKRSDQPGYAVRSTTDAAWTASAGDPFGGDTFSEHGVFAAIFLNGGVPVAGVQITQDRVSRSRPTTTTSRTPIRRPVRPSIPSRT